MVLADKANNERVILVEELTVAEPKTKMFNAILQKLPLKGKGEKTRDNQHGEFTFQGAYAYDITLEDGFNLKGRVTHYDDEEIFLKSGYYFRGDSSIKRSLYIEDVLYTLSDNRLQLNDLNNLNRLKVIEFAPGNSE